MIFVGCASRSPAAYERGINYPGASVWSLLRSLFASSPFSPHIAASFSLSPFLPSDYLIPPAPAITPRCRSFISLSLSFSLRLARSYRRSVSIMTPRGGTIPEVKSERRNHDVHSMESLSSTGTGCSKVATHALALSCARRKIRFSRPARSAFARTRVTREQLPRKCLVFEEESAAFRRELIDRSGVKAPGFRDVNIQLDIQREGKIEGRTKDRGKVIRRSEKQ